VNEKTENSTAGSAQFTDIDSVNVLGFWETQAIRPSRDCERIALCSGEISSAKRSFQLIFNSGFRWIIKRRGKTNRLG
jgi:hypothetical protein